MSFNSDFFVILISFEIFSIILNLIIPIGLEKTANGSEIRFSE